MIETAVLKIFTICCARPALTLVLYLLLAFGAVLYTYENFAIDTDTSQLISSRLPWRQRELQLDAAFPQQADTLLVVVDGASPELAGSGAKKLAAALANDHEHIKTVREIGGGAFFEHNGLLFLSTSEVRHTTEQLIRSQPFLGTLAADPTLRGLAQALAYIPKGAEEGKIDAADFATPLDRLSSTIDALLAGRPATFSWDELMAGEAPRPSELRRFINVKPILDFGSLQPGAAASATIRKTAEELGLNQNKGVRVRITGPVAMADDEFGTVADGALLNVILTAAAVLLILWFALRSGRLMFAVMLSLLVGLSITAAVGLAMVGTLNLISVAFAVLFVGIGVDFGIQVAVRYRQERHFKGDLQSALAATAARIAKPLTLAATATAAGFYAFLPTDYRGVSELGLISGTGMIVAFLISITLLPGLLVSLKPPPEPEAVGYRRLAPVDRFMARYRVPILVVAGLAIAAGLPLFRDLSFDFNPLNLRSAQVESVATLRDLVKDPETTPNVINVLTPNIDDAASLAQRLGQLLEVSGTVMIQSFVPKDQEEKLAIIQDAGALLEPTLDPLEIMTPPSDAETRAALDRAADTFLAADKNGVGTSGVAIEKSLRALAGTDGGRRADIESTLLNGLKLRLDQIRASLKPERVSLAELPDDLTRDWVAGDGRARSRGQAEGRPERQRGDAAVRRGGAPSRTRCNGHADPHSGIRQDHRARLFSGRRVGVAAHHHHAVSGVAPDRRRSGDARAPAARWRRDLGADGAGRPAAQFRQHHCLAAAPRRRRCLQDLLRAGMAGRGNQPAFFIAHSRRAVQRADHCLGFCQSLAVQSSRDVEHGQAAQPVADHNSDRCRAFPADPHGSAAPGCASRR